MNDIKDRILEILRKEGIMPSRFADEIGVQRSAISHIMNGRNKPGYDLIVKILKRFNKINAEWLILGEGEMYKKNLYDQNETKNKNDIINYKNLQSNENKREKEKLIESIIDNEIEQIIIIYKDKTFTLLNKR